MDAGFVGEGIFFLVVLLPFAIYFALVIFVVYFAVKMIKFMNKKTKLDKERNEKLAELMKVLGKDERE